MDIRRPFYTKRLNYKSRVCSNGRPFCSGRAAIEGCYSLTTLQVIGPEDNIKLQQRLATATG